MRRAYLEELAATADADNSLAQARPPADVQADQRAPAQLVESALREEIAGDDRQRAALLRAALREDPEYATALWHAGYVENDGYWVKADDPFHLVGRREALQQYRQRLDMIAKQRELLLQHRLEMERKGKADEIAELKAAIARLEQSVYRG